MGVIKLTAGSPKPPVTPGKVQLFGSEYNPYCQRIRMILIARDVPHDVYSASSWDKPAWWDSVQPDHKEPALCTDDGRTLTKGDVFKFLQEKYPGQGSDPALRDSNFELLKKFELVMENFFTALQNKDHKPSEKGREFFQAFDEELQKRGTTFLGGETPGTVDYMIWPWFERFRVPAMLHGIDRPPPSDRTPPKNMLAWREAMEKTKPVMETRHSLEEHVEVCKRWMQK
ncbi:pyrimidodiazepine synthase-like [Bacillus rossius redtenbacheri]|uniref:pyrimidodiazepine synthase-like n=1 Tax=Bacillus rossius redtenbacheri TaxID=93214 RepID=UPI002FDD4C77